MSSLKFKRTIKAASAEVYRAFTNPTAWRDWLSDAAQCEARPGGRLYLYWERGFYACGDYTGLEPERRVAFTWAGRGDPAPTRVTVSLAGKEGQTRLTLTHSGIGEGEEWAAARQEIEKGWSAGLENLQSVLEEGLDLRIARRPRMGIWIGDFDPQIAARLGTPAKEGIRLEGTVEGTGARAAGLQKDDVIVKLGGKKAVNFPSLSAALQGKHAGERVPVTFYRGAEKRTVMMELSSFPRPDYPPTAEALATAAREMYAQANAALAELTAGITPAEAAHRPAPGEWTALEMLAHYVACERDLQSWAAELLNGGNNAGEVQNSLEFRPNVTLRLAALVERYPSIPELLAELERAQAETLHVLAGLPPEFVARKPLYARLAGWVMEVIPAHIAEHRDQFAATVAAARGG